MKAVGVFCGSASGNLPAYAQAARLAGAAIAERLRGKRPLCGPLCHIR